MKDIWYHGSNNKFDMFDLVNNKTYKEIDLPVWFFTKDLNYAKTYGKFIYTVKLDIHSTFDTSNKKHFDMFIDYLKDDGKTTEEIDEILDEQFFKELPYWTCDDAYYCAMTNEFDSILIAEELEHDVESIGVFNKNNIKIINTEDKKLKNFIKTTIKEFLNEQSNVLLAPNGKPSNLSKDLYRYVRTDDFKTWFGDWENNPSRSSKIVDENGEPMLVYHGTKAKFNQFKDNHKIGWLGRGFYFTNNKGATKEYGKLTMKIFLNIRNPFIVKGDAPNDVEYEIRTKYNTTIDTDVSILLKQKGYDGVIFNHWDKGNMISCFTSNQIKIINKIENN